MLPVGGPRARFDDWGQGGRSFALVDPVAVLCAMSLGEVASVLIDAQAAARAGHWVAGYVAYEAAPAFDAALCVREQDDATLPLALFTVYRTRVPAPPLPTGGNVDCATHWEPQTSPAAHAAHVDRIRTLIEAGRVYQVNLTTHLVGRVHDPCGLYARMLAAQRCRYGALLTTDTHAVVCVSPELFFEAHDDEIVTRPMKGTSRRGRWPGEDAEAATALRASAKERAENVMIVDLLRNDLGRISTTGSVEVTRLLEVEPYPTVWQMTSTIRSRLPAATSLLDVFAALFPSGSVTGAPKVAAMTAIARLEQHPRGVYCGAIGFLEPGPTLRARFAVAIRTAVVDQVSGAATYGAGGGITWSSDAASEWKELIDKTAVLDRSALGTGLIETMRRLPDGSIRNLARHLARLRRSATALSIPLDEDELSAALGGASSSGRVRLRVSPAGSVDAQFEPMPAPPSGPVRLGLMPGSVSSQDRTLFHKFADRARYEHWRNQRPDVDDVILINERGEATETTIANLVVGVDGRWWTPALAAGLLPGIERERLLEAGVLAERPIPVPLLRGASLAVISSLRGWRCAVLVD